MKVFLTGATGYIGSAVAERLQAVGHEVTGLARSDESAQALQARRINVQRGDLQDAASITAAAEAADAVIHAASPSDATSAQADQTAIGAILNALEGANKPFIYTSGIWVLGNTGEHVANEDTPLNPASLVTWRPAIEQQVLAATKRGTRAIVIRPAIVYGSGGGIPGGMVKNARERGVVQFIGDGNNRWPFVHRNDLADLYVRALESAPAGTLLLAANGAAVTVREVAAAAAQSAGIEGRIEALPLADARKSMGPYADALVLDQQVSGERAKRLLGWSPQAPSILDDLRHGSYAGGGAVLFGEGV